MMIERYMVVKYLAMQQVKGSQKMIGTKQTIQGQYSLHLIWLMG